MLIPFTKIYLEFLHQKTTPSTKPSQTGKLQMSKRNYIQPTRIEPCRHKNSNHTKRIKLRSMYQELYSEHTRLHPDEKVSCGTFFGLKPSYITTETKKNMEMCSYKLHLHARWAIQGILKSAEQQKIKVPFSNPHSFFEKLTQQHTFSSTTYNEWCCTSNKKDFCYHIEQNCHDLSQILQYSSADTVCIPCRTFMMVEYVNHKGDPAKLLKQTTKSGCLQCQKS